MTSGPDRLTSPDPLSPLHSPLRVPSVRFSSDIFRNFCRFLDGYFKKEVGESEVEMPERCVAGFCSRTRADGVSLHRFPIDREVRKKWDGFVARGRRDWRGASGSTTRQRARFTT